MRPSSPNLRASAPRCADTAIVCPRDYHPRNSCHTSRRGTCPLATGASAGACGQGLSRSHGYRELPRGWSVSKISLPANVRLFARLSAASLHPVHLAPAVSGLAASPATSGTLALAAPRLLVQLHLPSGGRTLLGGLGKFLRTNMTAMPGKVACLYAICLSGPGSPCHMSLPSRAINSASCRAMT